MSKEGKNDKLTDWELREIMDVLLVSTNESMMEGVRKALHLDDVSLWEQELNSE